MKNVFSLAAVFTALSVASLPAAAMIKSQSVGMGLSKVKIGSTSTNVKPTLNYGITFDNNLMIGLGIAMTDEQHWNSEDIQNGVGGTISSIKETSNIDENYNLRAGYLFESEAVNFTPYIGVNYISYDYKKSNVITNENISDSQTVYLPFVGFDVSLVDAPSAVVGARITRSETKNGVKVESTPMVTFAYSF